MSTKENNYPITTKPWGYEKLIVHNKKYALKEIFLKQGCRSSLQSHHKKLETIYVLSGSLELETQEAKAPPQKMIYCKGEAYSIIPNLIHRVSALEDCLVIEVSTPELDDLIRHEDDYNRS